MELGLKRRACGRSAPLPAEALVIWLAVGAGEQAGEGEGRGAVARKIVVNWVRSPSSARNTSTTDSQLLGRDYLGRIGLLSALLTVAGAVLL
jgi:hypothetical protein